MAVATTTALALASAGMQAVGAISQGRAARKQADQAAALANQGAGLTEFQAQVSEQQAARERELAAAAAGDFARMQSATAAQARAALGASGVRGDTGSPVAAFGDFAAETELQRLRILSGGEATARRLEQQAVFQRFQAAGQRFEAGGLRTAGRNVQRRGLFRAGASLLSGLGTANEAGFFASGTGAGGFTATGFGTGV